MEEEQLIDKLVDSMEKATEAMGHVGDMLEEINTNLGFISNLLVRNSDERETNI
jgi:hypothetical protein